MTHLSENSSFKDDPHTAYPELPSVRDILDVVQGRLLRVALDEDADPDFHRLARGTQALVQLEGLLTRRRADRERKASETQDAKFTRLEDMAPFADEDLERLDRDAAKLRAMETHRARAAAIKAAAANDNDEVPARRCGASDEMEEEGESLADTTDQGRGSRSSATLVRELSSKSVREPPDIALDRKTPTQTSETSHDRTAPKPP